MGWDISTRRNSRKRMLCVGNGAGTSLIFRRAVDEIPALAVVVSSAMAAAVRRQSGIRCAAYDVRSLTPPMVSPGCSLLFGQFFGKCPFVIDLSRPFKDVNCKPVVVVRGLQEWLSHRLLYCFHGWHESRVRHDRHPQNEATTQRAEMPGARPHGLGWNPQHS